MDSNTIGRAVKGLKGRSDEGRDDAVEVGPRDPQTDRPIRGMPPSGHSVLDALEGPGARRLGLIGQTDRDGREGGQGPRRLTPEETEAGTQAAQQRDIQSYLNLNLDRLIIGSNRDSDIWLNHESVSRHHALFTRKANKFWLEDLGGGRGTFVNKRRITKHQLKDGDIVKLGSFRFLFVDRDRANRAGKERGLIALVDGEIHEPDLCSPELLVPLTDGDGAGSGALDTRPTLRLALFGLLSAALVVAALTYWAGAPDSTPRDVPPQAAVESDVSPAGSARGAIDPDGTPPDPLTRGPTPADPRSASDAPPDPHAGVATDAAAEGGGPTAGVASATEPADSAPATGPSVAGARIPAEAPAPRPRETTVNSAGPGNSDEGGTDSQTNRLLMKALIRQQQGALEESLALVNEGLALSPGHGGFVVLQEELQRLVAERSHGRSEQKAEVARLLADAAIHRNALRLTTPDGANAFETYQKVLKLDPYNDDAERGLALIAEEYFALAKTAKQKGQLEQSLTFLKRGLNVDPTHAGMVALRREFIAGLPSMGEQSDAWRKQQNGADQILAQVSQRLKEGNVPEALKLVQAGLQVMPGNPQLTAVAEKIERAIAREKYEQTQRQRGMEGASRFVAGLLAQARQQQEKGAYAESLASVEIGLRIMPQNAELIQMKADLTKKLADGKR